MNGVIRYLARDALAESLKQAIAKNEPGMWVRAADFDESQFQSKQREVALQDRLTGCDEQLDAQRLRADTAEADVQEVCKTVEAVTASLAAAEQRIAELKSVLERMLEDDDMPVHWFAQRIDAALNPNPEAESHGS